MFKPTKKEKEKLNTINKYPENQISIEKNMNENKQFVERKREREKKKKKISNTNTHRNQRTKRPINSNKRKHNQDGKRVFILPIGKN